MNQMGKSMWMYLLVSVLVITGVAYVKADTAKELLTQTTSNLYQNLQQAQIQFCELSLQQRSLLKQLDRVESDMEIVEQQIMNFKTMLQLADSTIKSATD
jgi:ABC-type transport system involved in cytochrome bd biosynthesis fused ATPase/permease subunit